MHGTGVAAFAARPFASLSGGEQARVALARVLAKGRVVACGPPPAGPDRRAALQADLAFSYGSAWTTRVQADGVRFYRFNGARSRWPTPARVRAPC
ncbi:hypothetical protein [Actinomadura rubrisoli]|uniref:hypothetical protein n=1 Tax=Actinomadura rubrisoli TaxID=2530368 RepID=UPI00267A5953